MIPTPSSLPPVTGGWLREKSVDATGVTLGWPRSVDLCADSFITVSDTGCVSSEKLILMDARRRKPILRSGLSVRNDPKARSQLTRAILKRRICAIHFGCSALVVL